MEWNDGEKNKCKKEGAAAEDRYADRHPGTAFRIRHHTASLAFFDNISYAFYLSRMFFPQEVAIAQTNLSDSSTSVELTTTPTQLSFPKYGDEYGTLSVDAANIISPVFVGDDATQLLYGAAQYYGSVFPGDIGNTVIAGHTNSVFKTLGEAQIGDNIRLELTYGTYV